MKEHVISLLNQGDHMINVAVYFLNLSKLTAKEAIEIAEEIGNTTFTERLKESYGLI